MVLSPELADLERERDALSGQLEQARQALEAGGQERENLAGRLEQTDLALAGGGQLLVRPDPQAIWNTPRSHPGWKKNAGRYARSSRP